MLRCFQADLHIHTCLSPCADLTMSPFRIVKRAREMKLNIIGICDHNSAENVHAAKNASSDMNITVLTGMEVTSAEEVHIIALFDGIKEALELQTLVYEHLPPGENNEELFGPQIIANELDEVEGVGYACWEESFDLLKIFYEPTDQDIPKLIKRIDSKVTELSDRI